MARKTEPRYETEKAAFPKNLRTLMEEHSVTQRALAKVIGMRPQTVSLYIGGQSVPDINTLYRIAEYFNVTADWLIGRPGSSKRLDANLAAAIKYTGLSEEVVQKLHAFSAGKSGAGVGEDFIEHIDTINLLLCSEDGLGALNEIGFFRAYTRRASIPKSVLSREDLDKMNELATASGNEIANRNELRELHLELAAERIKAACRKME